MLKRKKILLITILISIFSGIGVYYFLYKIYPVIEMQRILNDKTIYNRVENNKEYLKRMYILNKYEIGIIELKDGGSVKYIFLSHHLNKLHESISFFKFKNEKYYMRGYFCCEVELEKQPINYSELKKFLRNNNGKSP